MSPSFPVVRFVGLTAACFGIGYGLYLTIVPDPEKVYQSLPPARRRQIDEAREKRQAWEAEMAKQVRAQREHGPMKPIWDSDTTTPKPPPA